MDRHIWFDCASGCSLLHWKSTGCYQSYRQSWCLELCHTTLAGKVQSIGSLPCCFAFSADVSLVVLSWAWEQQPEHTAMVCWCGLS